MKSSYKQLKIKEKKQLKELKNIDKSKTLKALDEIKRKNDEANKLVPTFKRIDSTLDKTEPVCTKTDGTKYDVNHFALPLKFIEKVHNYVITLDEAIDDQTELKILRNKLNNDYNPKLSRKSKRKK